MFTSVRECREMCEEDEDRDTDGRCVVEVSGGERRRFGCGGGARGDEAQRVQDGDGRMLSKG